ncbi:hypothetical protein FOL47_002158 [Perkinsus chesapeaki]|uniref:Uncharacterized protein n=1 Tax=Perkinsus chesapeaki TaxID=330153 RepID=A0A7J6MGR3_PERCH|nr:hypothetical protein FOL47_002158 [Perkinsus chesapeaki]
MHKEAQTDNNVDNLEVLNMPQNSCGSNLGLAAVHGQLNQAPRLDRSGAPLNLGEKSSEIVGMCINYNGGPSISRRAPLKWSKPRASCDLVRFAHQYEATLGSNPYAQKPIFSSPRSRRPFDSADYDCCWPLPLMEASHHSVIFSAMEKEK